MATYRKRTDRPNLPHQIRWYRPDGKLEGESFSTKAEANAFKAKIEEDLRTGTWVDLSKAKLTFGEWFDEWWPTTINLAYKTRQQNRDYYRSYIGPTFATVPLIKITWAAIQTWVNDLSATGGKKGEGLSPATVRKAEQTLSKILDAAIKHGRLAVNPCAHVTLPAGEDEEARFLTPDELVALEDAMPERWRDFVPFVADTGLRIGEVAALRWRDIDFLHLEVTVREGLKEVSKDISGAATGVMIGTVKTRAGRRVVPTLTRETANRLEERKRKTGAGPNDHVFVGERGGLMAPNNFRARVFRPAVEAADLADPQPTPHSLRHSAVAAWIAAGVTDKFELKTYAGHRSIETIDNIYGHLLPRDASDARKAMSAMRATARAAADERAASSGEVISLDSRR